MNRFLLRMRFACIVGLAIGGLMNAAAFVGDALALGTITYALVMILFVVGAIGGEIALRREWRRRSDEDRSTPGSTR
ncbi:hypothetical protein NSA19_01915 [Actinomyces bowdenii]|uniref:hypothetical protein n=1 Tax=Actinomyces bowdenii TaxID=131109 RepID=UPI00214B229E|nr:hypothetical protein [Actinomyces bowdenii]MCR2051629.1 hypothetical protein [Actinomyces bowdenii]